MRIGVGGPLSGRRAQLREAAVRNVTPCASNASTPIGMASTACRVAAAVIATGLILEPTGAALAQTTSDAVPITRPTAGISSPALPDFLKDSMERLRLQKQEERARQAQADATFQQSGTLQELLARSKANKQKNLEQIKDKYCER